MGTKSNASNSSEKQNPNNSSIGTTTTSNQKQKDSKTDFKSTEEDKKKKKETKASSSSAEKSPSEKSSGGIDAHPYARGSVIEVYHIQKSTDGNDSSDSSDDDDIDYSNLSSSNLPKNVSIRLCDIIDRSPSSSSSSSSSTTKTSKSTLWKYYVHYRDFNRRMDEWISLHRIVSPPSVGNAKIRALKKKKEEEERRAAIKREEESGGGGRRKRKRGQSGREVELLENEGELSRPRLSRSSSRKSGASMGGGGAPSVSGGSTTDMTSTVSAEGGVEGEQEDVGVAQRLTRRQRKRRSTADAPADAASPEGAAEGGGVAATSSSSTLIAAATAAVGQAEEHIGVDVVATVPAQELDEHEGLDEASLREHEEVTKVKNVMEVELGPYRMETWYFSPIPKELLKDGVVEVLYVCEFTLDFFTRKCELLRYQAKLPKERRHPPGNEIYRNGNLSMFEVDGFDERIYCQNLCYIAKMFLDHKTLYYDVDPFLFYVLCEVDERGFHPVGYYSKEKYSDVGYNLACILTFPSQQRKGYGRFLISFSYELSKKEEKVGSPEKPISDLGQQAYLPYWTSTIVDFLRNTADEGSMSIMDISKRTSIMAEDIVFALNQLGILKFINGVYFIAAERNLLEQLARKHPVKEPRVDPTKLHWTPFITDVKRDKFSIHSKKPSVQNEEARGNAEA